MTRRRKSSAVHAPFGALTACLGGLCAAVLAGPASAQQIGSVYSTLDWEAGCTVLERAPEGEGGWVRLVCQGHAGYPVFVSDGDDRMSLAYGFAGPTGWNSFTGFNRVHDTIEWRVLETETGKRPFATIHRWYVNDADGNERQVLVVSTVAQPEGGQSCRVGFVDAAANRDANARARRIADELSRGFACGADRPGYHGATTAATPQPMGE